MPTLDGVFCRQCNETSTYYVPAEHSTDAHCDACEDAVSNGLQSVLVISLIALCLAVMACAIMFKYCRGGKADAWRGRVIIAEEKYSLLNKLKTLVGFCKSLGHRTWGGPLYVCAATDESPYRSSRPQIRLLSRWTASTRFVFRRRFVPSCATSSSPSR